MSSYRSPVWPTGAFLEANCRLQETPDHPAPDPHCRCGIYARLSVDAFSGHLDGGEGPLIGPCVLAEVELSGRVLRYENGYRAQRARPTRLMIRCVPCWLEGAYSYVPATVIWHAPGITHGLQAACDRHAPAKTIASASATCASLLESYGCLLLKPCHH